MPQTTLSQSQIDALIASAGRTVEEFDYRGGKLFDQNALVEIDGLHAAFARDLSQRFSHMLQVSVLVEAHSTDQARYDSYVNSLPSPTIVGVIELNPTDSLIVADVSNHLGFAMLDLMLGGSGRPTVFRTFTELEGNLLAEMVDHIGGAIATAFETQQPLEPRVAAVQAVPAISHVAVSSEPALVLSFRVKLEIAQRTEGILSICYPRRALDSVFGRDRDEDSAVEDTIPSDSLMADPLADTTVKLSARLKPSKLSLFELSQLQPGDVVVLGHPVGEPATVSIGGVTLFEGEVGRHNGHMALQLTHWIAQ